MGMVDLIQQGVLGIVTGILTTTILFICKIIWDTRLQPFLRELRYAGVKIDGKWVGRGTDPQGLWTTEMLLLLKQSAFELTGTFNLKHQGVENKFEILFNVSGRIWEGYIILNLSPIDRRITSYATAMLKIDGGGVGLVGQIAYRDVFKEYVVSEPVSMGREP